MHRHMRRSLEARRPAPPPRSVERDRPSVPCPLACPPVASKTILWLPGRECRRTRFSRPRRSPAYSARRRGAPRRGPIAAAARALEADCSNTALWCPENTVAGSSASAGVGGGGLRRWHSHLRGAVRQRSRCRLPTLIERRGRFAGRRLLRASSSSSSLSRWRSGGLASAVRGRLWCRGGRERGGVDLAIGVLSRRAEPLTFEVA